MSKIIGIDLGTTNSCVSVILDGQSVVIPNSEGSRTTPSVVAFTNDGGRLVGHIARRQAVTNPTRTLFAVKRLMGRRFEDEAVQRALGMLPYKIVHSERGDAWVEVDEESWSPPQIGAIVLEHMKETAEAYLGEEVSQAIVTVPAYFNDSQRQATKDAGRIAGLEILRIINEPTAASLAYGVGRRERERIAVFDLGGGTFDVSLLELQNGIFQVLSTNGDTFLGGEDFDQRIVRWLLDTFEEEHGVDLSDQVVAIQRLKEAAEIAKHELSSDLETDINLPFIASGPEGALHLQASLSRNKLEELVEDLIERLGPPCVNAIEDASIGMEDIDSVLLVGGMTRMPRVRERVKEIFGKESRDDINPDEVVSVGAALQGSVLTGEVKDVLLLDVTPLSLGIETAGGIFEKIIERNTTIPSKRSNIFTTAQDNQDMVRVSVFQGEREMAEDNKFLGRLELSGIPPAPRGLPEIQVSFEIDANGIMHVKAKDLGTGRAQKMRIVSDSGLSEDEIYAMVNEAETYREQDSKRKETVESRNQLDGLIYTTQRSLDEYGDALSEEEVAHIRDTLAQAEGVLESSNLELINTLRDELSQVAQRLAESLYAAASEDLDELVDEFFDEEGNYLEEDLLEADEEDALLEDDAELLDE